MQDKTIGPGEKVIGRDKYTIDDVTNDAVVVLSVESRPEVAVMRLRVSDTHEVYARIDGLVREYEAFLKPRARTERKDIHAAVIGGQFSEHRVVCDKLIVHFDYDVLRRRAEEALAVAGLQAQYVDTDVRATKTVTVEPRGEIGLTEIRKGLNREEATLSQTDYERGIGKYRVTHC